MNDYEFSHSFAPAWAIIRDVSPCDVELTDEECIELWDRAVKHADQNAPFTADAARRSERAEAMADYLHNEKKRIRRERISNGAHCMLVNYGDALMDFDAKRLNGVECFIVKRTKGGLLQIASVEFPKVRASVTEKQVRLLAKSEWTPIQQPEAEKCAA